MRKAVKILHTLGSCGLIGALAGYMVVLAFGRFETASDYAAVRHTIGAVCNYLLFPSLALVLITGLLSMVVHRPFQDMGWVWLKALLGLSMFEATLGIINSKASAALELADKIAAGKASPDALAATVAHEWTALGVIMLLSLANVVIGVWRPRLNWRWPVS